MRSAKDFFQPMAIGAPAMNGPWVATSPNLASILRSSMTMKCQGWELLELGAQRAA